MRLVVLGAGGHGKSVADAALQSYSSVLFLDDSWDTDTPKSFSPIVGKIDEKSINKYRDDDFVVAIGDNAVRMSLIDMLVGMEVSLVNIVHPFSYVSPSVEFGVGIVVLGGGVVNVNATLGDGVIINTGASIDHDCTIRKGVHVAPGVSISGNVEIGSCALIGVGASVKQGINIKSNSIVGAGSVVLDDVPHGATVVGSPARVL